MSWPVGVPDRSSDTPPIVLNSLTLKVRFFVTGRGAHRPVVITGLSLTPKRTGWSGKLRYAPRICISVSPLVAFEQHSEGIRDCAIIVVIIYT